MKTATFEIFKEMIFFDIDSRTTKRTGATLSDASPSTQASLTSNHMDAVNNYLLSRYSDKWNASLRQRLLFCLEKTTATTLSYTDKPDAKVKYTYTVNVPDDFNADNMNVVGSNIHEYIVRGCLYDWYVYSGIQPTDTQETIEALADSIVSALRGKSYGKKPIQPYGPGPDVYEF